MPKELAPISPRTTKLLRRLVAKFSVDPETGCYIWQGGCDPDGYGRLSLRENGHNSSYRVHRLAAAIFLGIDITDHRFVLHSCDNPRCWNPEHLRPGSAADNARDRSERGRHRGYGKGSKHPFAKLTEEQVYDIKLRLLVGAKQRDLAREYGVTSSRINAIAKNKNWQHVRLA